MICKRNNNEAFRPCPIKHKSDLFSRGIAKLFNLHGTWQTPIVRRLCNLVPAFRATGARITYLSPDGHELHIELPRRLRNLNVHGAIYGGSIYSAVAGLPGAMLIRLLGPRYFVALTASSVRFLRPSRTTITGTMRILPREIDEIRQALEQQSTIERVFAVELLNAQDQVCCTVSNTMHIARQRYEEK